MRHRILLASLILPQLLDHERPKPQEPQPPPEPTPTPRPMEALAQLRRHPLRLPCPRCKVKAGEECNRRTLGRKRFHMARIKALQAILAEEAP